jgi:3-isopropylmalate/(R)-2-methylmalate dehydratase small subunit
VPVEVPRDAQEKLFKAVAENPEVTVTVDLAQQKLILPDGSAVEFPIDEFSKHCLLEGVDELGYILQQEDAIAAYEARRPLTINALA